MSDELHSRHGLAPGAVEAFRSSGFIHLSNVLPPRVLERYETEITARVVELTTTHLPLEERSTYDRAFLQVMNLWCESEIVRELVFSQRLARLAADLLGTQGVRLYHDQALYKEPGGGITPWHADQYYWPFSSPATCTAWIPLQETPLELGPLSFALGSHKVDLGRSLGISDESEREIQDALAAHGFEHVEEPYALGDVSFHYGWTFHRAGANRSDRPRGVLTVIYMDADIVVEEPTNGAQRHDLDTWLRGARVGGVPDGPLNPLAWAP